MVPIPESRQALGGSSAQRSRVRKVMECKMIVCTLPINDGRVLLVKYRDMPDHQQGWFVPHVLLNDRENPADAAIRVLQDQFKVADTKPVFNHFESFTGRDGSWHLVFHFKARL